MQISNRESVTLYVLGIAATMGQRITRPIRNFNVENRAAKALESQKKAPKAAPKHASTVDAISHIQQSETCFI